MALPNKPSIKNVWATSGVKVEPSDTKVNTGWIVERPPHQFQNFLQNRSDQFLKHINEAGIPLWDAVTVYTAGKSYAQGSDGKIYKCLVDGFNENPVGNPTKWVMTFGDLDVLEYANQASDSAIAAANSASGAATSATTAVNTLAVFDDTPPASPFGGRHWTDSNTGKTYEWIVDADGGQWVEVGSPTAVAATAFAEYLGTVNGASLIGTPEGTVQEVLDNIGLTGAVKTVDLAAPLTVAIGGYTIAETQNTLDNAKTLQDYTTLRAYTGRATGVRITVQGIAGSFQLDLSDTTSTDNGGTVIVDALSRRWKRIIAGEIWIDWFGADTTGVLDSSAQVVAAAAVAGSTKVLKGAGVIRLTNQVNLRSVRVDFSGATVSLDSTTPPLLIGGNAQTTVNPRQQFKRVNRTGGATSEPTVRMMGSKDQEIQIDNVDYFQIYADTTAPNSASNGSIGYCTFNLGRVSKLELTNNPVNVGAGAGDGGSIQWINENVFNIQRCSECIISGTYEHNHNKIVGGTFESTSTITILKGWDNYFLDMRFEGTPTVTFAAGTERNMVINTWDSSTSNYDQTSAIVIDDGFDNMVVDDFSFYRFAENVAYTDIADVVLDTRIYSSGSPRVPDLQRIYHATSNASLIDSGFIPIVEGDYFRWVTVDPTNNTAGENSRYRPRIEFYDAKLMPVTASLDFILSTGGNLTVAVTNSISNGTNVNGAVAVIKKAAITAGVKFVKVNWRGNSPTTVGISQAIQMYITHMTKKSERFRGIPGPRNLPTGVGVLTSGIPTKGYAPFGYAAIKSDGTAKYINSFAFETSTTGANAGATTVISISAGTGTANGDIVGINLDDGSTHWTTVASGGGTTSITLTVAIPSASASGSRVVFNRWLAY